MLQFQMNSKVHPSKLTQILEAKWREFQESNPANKKDMKDENGSDISEPVTGKLWDFLCSKMNIDYKETSVHSTALLY
jgi:CHDNT (NUC034) domain